MYYQPPTNANLGRKKAITAAIAEVGPLVESKGQMLSSEKKSLEEAQSSLDTLSSINPGSLTLADGHVIGRLPFRIRWPAQQYVEAKRDEATQTFGARSTWRSMTEHALLDLQIAISSEKSDLADQIQIRKVSVEKLVSELQELKAQQINARKALAQVEAEEKEQADRHKATEMIHYEDRVLDETIAPGMTRHFEFTGEGKPEWTMELRILDHFFRRAGTPTSE